MGTILTGCSADGGQTVHFTFNLRAALTDRDPIVARSTRFTVVESIRVLHEREQIDGDEAEWMLREALREN